MGQPVHMMVFAITEDAGLEACAAALAELRRVEARLTVFDAASDLSELNRRAGRGPMHVDEDLGAVLGLAAGFQRESGGTFNVAVEPLMRVWGFHRPRRTTASTGRSGYSGLAESRGPFWM
jgi:thiamine biosynthesis lipoprotein